MHKYPDLSDYLQSTMQQVSVLFIVFKMILEIALGNGLREWFLESYKMPSKYLPFKEIKNNSSALRHYSFLSDLDSNNFVLKY